MVTMGMWLYYNKLMQIYSEKLFKNPIEIVEAEGDLSEAFKRLEALREKYYLLGYITYDFKKLYFEVFDKFEKYIPNSPKQLGTMISPQITKSQYISAIKKIKDYIANGVTYEVNYTYPSTVLTNLDGIDLYEAILPRQKTLYNTFLQTKDVTLLSFSPELFFRLEGRKITTKPMKGTAPHLNDGKDEERFEFLKNDIKNKAENIMIVDLLRNDLGQIAKTGSVKVDKLFEIEEHPTVFQMTSEISAELEDNVTLLDIFKAIFPCGSITGAPKLSTMKVIDELEPFNRNIYCGAIGFLSPEVCEFSVPIRILYGKDHKYTYHAGGAIVWDSTEEEEWEETLTKTQFLQTDFKLIETAIDDWESHVARMKNSAQQLGFVWKEDIEHVKVEGLTRVLLDKNGNFEVQKKELLPILSNKIKIGRKMNSNNPFLYHKTTVRTPKPDGIFDIIAVNERGEITEGTFTNVAVLQNGELFTPPVKCGLLDGTYRKKLLEKGVLKEKILYSKDLETAEKIFCFNSVRKMVEVELC